MMANLCGSPANITRCVPGAKPGTVEPHAAGCGAATLILVLALPSVLGAQDDVHRISAGMFTISYACAMALSVLVGWLWDLTRLPIAGFAPVALCGLLIAALASTVKKARPGG